MRSPLARPVATVALLAILFANAGSARAQIVPPMPPTGFGSGPAASVADTCAKKPYDSIAGKVSFKGKALTPSVIGIMPQNDGTSAYIDNMSMAFGDPANRRRSLAVGSNSQMMARTMYVATHQQDILSSMQYVQPTGSHFHCGGLSPGPYYVMAIINQAYKPAGQYSQYVRQSNRLVFYVALTTLKKRTNHVTKPKTLPDVPLQFFYVGATASAM